MTSPVLYTRAESQAESSILTTRPAFLAIFVTFVPSLHNSLALISQVEALKEENDSLRWQLDAYRNEVELLKQEQGKVSREEDTTKEQQLKLLQQALQGVQQVELSFPRNMFMLQM